MQLGNACMGKGNPLGSRVGVLEHGQGVKAGLGATEIYFNCFFFGNK